MKGIRILTLVAALSLSLAAAEAANTNWTFQGCWAQFSSSPCYDVYTDASGSYWRCAACGTTKSPGSHTCVRIAPATGFWCS